MSRFSLLDPIISSQARSNVRQTVLRFARGKDWANAQYAQLRAPILLIGSARGGTTLLSNIVDAHPQVLIFNERFTVGKQSYRQTLGATTTAPALARAFLPFIPHAVKVRHQRWGIKLCTHHWTRDDLDRFITTFPQLRIIFVVRDGRDVVLSMLQRSKELKTADQCARRWLQSTAVLEYLQSEHNDQLLNLRYENLVNDSEQEVKKICSFINETFAPQMLEHTAWPGHGSYEITPVRTDKVGKWRNQPLPELPPDLQQQFQTALARLGYTSEPAWTT